MSIDLVPVGKFVRLTKSQVQEIFAEPAPAPVKKALRRGLEQVGNGEFATIPEAIELRVGPGTFDQFLTAFDADDAGTEAGDGQREIAQAAEHVGNALAGPGLEQGHGTTDQQFVHPVIDLGEFRGREMQREAKFRQHVAKRRCVGRMEQMHGRRTFRLQIPDDAVGVCKSP